MAAVGHWRDGKKLDYEGSYGFAHDHITHGLVRASQRHVDELISTEGSPVLSHRRSQPLQSGEVVRLRIPMLPSSTKLNTGDEIVLELHAHWLWPHKPAVGQFPAKYVTLENPAPVVVHVGDESESALVIPRRGE